MTVPKNGKKKHKRKKALIKSLKLARIFLMEKRRQVSSTTIGRSRLTSSIFTEGARKSPLRAGVHKSCELRINRYKMMNNDRKVDYGVKTVE